MAEHSQILVTGKPGQGPALVFSAPISFWGGIDPATGNVIDVRHPEHGACIAGTVLFLTSTIGSSSASAVLLELVHRNLAPAAIVMHGADAILLIGLISAREMGWTVPMAIQLERRRHSFYAGELVAVEASGAIEIISR